MAEDEMQYTVPDKGGDDAKAAEPRQVPVSFSGRRVPTSYASAFRTSAMDGMICLTYGVSYPEGQGLSVDMERRIVMTPQAAANMVNAVARLLRPAGQAEAPQGEAAPAEEAGETEPFGQN